MIHGAAHLFFEAKIHDLTNEFNGKINKLNAFIRKELLKLHDIHMGEIRKLKTEVRALKNEMVDIRRSEDVLSQTGMHKIRLTREVKDELTDITEIKGDVMHLKDEITDIKHHEDDMTHAGMHQITKMNKEMKAEVKHLKSHIKTLKRNVMEAKETAKDNTDPWHDAWAKDVANLKIHALNLSQDEVGELVAIRDTLHAAYEKTVKPVVTSLGENEKPPEDQTVEAGRNSLNLWVTSSLPPAPRHDDAIQLSPAVILYVKAPNPQVSPTSSNLASLHWSSQEDIDHYGGLTRNSSVDYTGRSIGKRGSLDTTDDEDSHVSHDPDPSHAHHGPVHHHPDSSHAHQGSAHHHLDSSHAHHGSTDHHADRSHAHHGPVHHHPDSSHAHHGSSHHYPHHHHLVSSLHEAGRDSRPLTPVPSEDEENPDEGIKMSVDRNQESGKTEDSNVTEETHEEKQV